MSKKYYITTAIAYTSKIPHIGNTYEAIVTDAIARFKRQVGYDVYFLTGTDEHGQKIQEQAKEQGITPKEHVDHIAAEIKRIWDLMEVSYDQFIRTTDDHHKRTVQKIFKKLYEQGDIYKDKYEGLYCVPCESFFTEAQLEDGHCPDCGGPVEQASEEAYFFKLSKYADRLAAHIEAHPEFIWPEARKNEMINNFIKPGLQDLCVSRTSFNWGVPVDFDEGHVVYVWIDALSNYISALGFDINGDHGELYKKYWPADVHVIGKDIVRFHTIYWPIILMALGEPLPKQVFGHSWLLTGKDKMSKSKGNVIYADDLVTLFGVDAVRYYVLREMPFGQDGNITYEGMISRLNTDFANILGNLLNRTISMVNKYFDGVIPAPGPYNELDQEMIKAAYGARDEVFEQMENLHVADALEAIWTLLRRSNKYIDETTPWVLGKDAAQHERLGTVLYVLLENIRYAAVLLSSFIPSTSKEMKRQLKLADLSWASLEVYGQTVSATQLEKGSPIFQRIDEEEKLKEIEAINQPVSDDIEVTFKEEITIDDFAKVDFKVAQIIEAKKHPKADKLLVLQLKVGNTNRQVVSGIAEHYKPEDLVGMKVILVANLKPIKLRGVESNGMILAATDDGSLKLVSADIRSGATVS